MLLYVDISMTERLNKCSWINSIPDKYFPYCELSSDVDPNEKHIYPEGWCSQNTWPRPQSSVHCIDDPSINCQFSQPGTDWSLWPAISRILDHLFPTGGHQAGNSCYSITWNLLAERKIVNQGEKFAYAISVVAAPDFWTVSRKQQRSYASLLKRNVSWGYSDLEACCWLDFIVLLLQMKRNIAISVLTQKVRIDSALSCKLNGKI